jgi:hypothetical protein
MGSKTRKAQCTTLCVCDSNKEKRSKNASIDPGRTSLLDSEDLKVMSADQKRIHDGWLIHVDYSRTLTAREKFLRLRLPLGWQKRNLMLQGRRKWRPDAKPIRLSKRALWGKGRLIKEFPYFLYERWLQVGTSKNNLAHTFTYFANFEVLTLVVSKVQHFSSFMQCVCFCSMVLMMHVRTTRLPICVSDCKGNQSREGICVTSCYLTTNIPSALLVAVGWLQHTRYPRFRRGTFDYGVTTSSNREVE